MKAIWLVLAVAAARGNRTPSGSRHPQLRLQECSDRGTRRRPRHLDQSGRRRAHGDVRRRRQQRPTLHRHASRAGATFSHTFNQAGTYPYFCDRHHFMRWKFAMK
jgi:hypothetical protein